MSGSYFPFAFVEQDELKGFDVNVMNAEGDFTDDDVEFVSARFLGQAGMLESERIDTIANQLAVPAECEAKYVFTSI